MTQGHVDYNRIQAGMKLRKLELEAYSSLINAFRAQGNFGKEKKRILFELRSYLSITLERHQAEVRRAVNDDKLSKISSSLNHGQDASDAWVIEGRRVIPLLKRMAPRTAVSSLADKVARYQVRQNNLEQAAAAAAAAAAASSAATSSTLSTTEQKTCDHNHSDLNALQSSTGDEQASCRKIDDVLSNQPSRKRVNSNASSSGTKRKVIAQQEKVKNSNSSKSSVSTITLPEITTTNPNSGNLVLDRPNQARLLIMNKQAIPYAAHTLSSSSDQLINVNSNTSGIDLDDTLSKPSQTTSPSPSSCSSFTNIQSSSTSSSSSNNAPAIVTSTNRIYNSTTKVQSASSPKLMILPTNNSGSNSGQQAKTLTIPISHNVKTLQLPTQNSTILYSTQQAGLMSSHAGSTTTLNCASNTIKTMPGITIQAIKTQAGNKTSNQQFIIMPNKTATNIASNANSTQAKGLLRQMNVKEVHPLRFISTATATTKDQATNQQQPSSGDNVIKLSDDAHQLNEGCSQQPMIIFTTNVGKDGVHSLTDGAANAQIRNLIKNQNFSGHPNIIKILPRGITTTNLVANSQGVAKSSPINVIPAGSNAATLLEFIKNIPINRIAAPSDSSKTAIPSSSTKTNTIKVPISQNSEPIKKLIISELVMPNNSMNNIATKATSPDKSETSSNALVMAPEANKKITLIAKTTMNSTTSSQISDNTMETTTHTVSTFDEKDADSFVECVASNPVAEVEKALENLHRNDLTQNEKNESNHELLNDEIRESTSSCMKERHNLETS